MKTGNKITLIFDVVVLTKVKPINKLYYAEMPGNNGPYRLLPEDEGVRWLHGHYLFDSPEVDACRVALALGKQEPEKQAPQQLHVPLFTRAIVDITARVLTNLILEKKP